MRKSLTIATWLGSFAVSIAALVPPADADSFSMSAGMQSDPGPVCFQWGVIGLGANKYTYPECFEQRYIMPLYWRNFYSASTNRTVQVRGRVGSTSSLMSCTLYVHGSNGAVVSQATASFPNTVSTYQSISLTVNNVSSSSTSYVSCSMLGDQTWLAKVDYAP